MSNILTLPVYEVLALERLVRSCKSNDANVQEDFTSELMRTCMFVDVRGLRFTVTVGTSYFMVRHWFLAYEQTAADGYYVLDARNVKTAVKGLSGNSIASIDMDTVLRKGVNPDWLKHLDFDSFCDARNVKTGVGAQMFNAGLLAGVTRCIAELRPTRPVLWHTPDKSYIPMCAEVEGLDFTIKKGEVCYGNLTAILMPVKGC